MEKVVKSDLIVCPNRIRAVLAERCVTNRWLAEQMGVTDMTVSRWVTNKVQPSMTQFVQMSKLFGTKLEDLLEPEFLNS
ncbi:MAG: helix-turn-helix transcriptional regulator [Bacteroides heparinolyticus]|nr:helix-turn-helix transcriptional regulator [Bacteroides heparinolyticus]